MGHRVAVLSNGKLLQCASPRELYDNPVNQFVAGFIGSPAMNLLTAPLTDGGARLAGTVVPLASAVRVAADRDRLAEIVLGIRPEQMHLTEAGGSEAAPPTGGRASGNSASGGSASDPGGAVLLGDVVLVEELGADALLHVRLADDGGAVVARAEGRKPPPPGQRVAFRIQSADVLAFNPATGARLAG